MVFRRSRVWVSLKQIRLSVSAHTKFAYSFGQLAEGIKTSSFSLFLLFYYNQVLGVSGTLCAIALFIAMCFDAITDPLVGSISDNWRSRWGRRHPFIYISVVPLTLGYFLLFNPLVEGEVALFVWMTVVAVLLRFMLTLYHVPHLALGAELTSDYTERTTLVAFRNVFGAFGYVLVYGLGFGIFFVASPEFPNGQLDREAYPAFAAIMAICMGLSVFYLGLGTHKAALALPTPTTRRTSFTGVFKDILETSVNKSFRILVFGFLAISLPIGIGASLALYLNTFFWQVEPGYMTLILTAGPLASLVGYALAPLVSRLVEKKQALIWGGLGWLFFYGGPPAFYHLGFFPAPGTFEVVIGLIFCHAMAGLIVSQLVVAVGSMLADVADEHDLDTGKRSEGAFFGAYAFIIKATAGMGPALSGLVLDAISWPAGDHIRTAADVPADSLFALSLVAGPFLAAGALPAVYIFSRYRLSKQKHAEILEALATRG